MLTLTLILSTRTDSCSSQIVDRMVDQTRQLITLSGSPYSQRALSDLPNFSSKLAGGDQWVVKLDGGCDVRFETDTGDLLAFRIPQLRTPPSQAPATDEEVRQAAIGMIRALHNTCQTFIATLDLPVQGEHYAHVVPWYHGRQTTQGCWVEFNAGSSKPTGVLSQAQLNYEAMGAAPVVSMATARARAIDAYLRGRPMPTGKLIRCNLRVGMPSPSGGASLSEMTQGDLRNIRDRVAIPFFEATFVHSGASTIDDSAQIQKVAVDARDGRALLMLEFFTSGSGKPVKPLPKKMEVGIVGSRTRGFLVKDESTPQGAKTSVLFKVGDSFLTGTYFAKNGLISFATTSKAQVFRCDRKIAKALSSMAQRPRQPFGKPKRP